MRHITIRGARTHNLKNIDVEIPRNELTVITGLSGSGKSSLAFDTLYAEGQRRYVESLSAYARQFLSIMEKPDVDSIEGLSPAISIEQKATSHNPRSTVGTVTEIYDYLRLLFARVGEPRCPTHGLPLHAQTVSQMVDKVLTLPLDAKAMILAPVIRDRKGEHALLLRQLQARGYVRVRIDGDMYELDAPPQLSLRQKHTIEVVVDRFKVRPDAAQRLSESFENALNLAEGLAIIAPMDDDFSEIIFSSKFACMECGYNLDELEPRLFSFNNPAGACSHCDGLGVDSFFDPERVVHNPKASLADGAIRGWDRKTMYYFLMLESLARHYEFDVEAPFAELPEPIRDIILYGSNGQAIEFRYLSHRGEYSSKCHPFEGIIPNMQRRYKESGSSMMREELARYLSSRPCEVCCGARLREEARHVYVTDKSLPELTSYSIDKAYDFFKNLTLPGSRGEIAAKINKEIVERLGFLVNVGLDYLSLSRSAETLSGGEAQRIRLASQIGSGLVGVMYVLDEPSIGLHQRDNARLLKTLVHLRDLGNTVIVVEHDEEAIRAADFILDVGPGAGVHGGVIVACGKAADIMNCPGSITGQYLAGVQSIAVPAKRLKIDPSRMISLTGVCCNNLNNVNVEIPLAVMTCITGVSGSGKSSLINDTLYPMAANLLNKASVMMTGKLSSIRGLEWCDKVIDIDQSPIGRTPRSNPATYTGLFTPIRELFAGTQESRARGYQIGRFSFNVRGGRCEACQGDGLIKVEMHFLPDTYVPCDVCRGKRYNRETLDVHYKGKSIHEVLEFTVEEANDFFAAIPLIARKCQTLIDVGLPYIRLGQSATTLSGGEAQRIKLARELSKRDTGNTLYILDEPTTGLHFHDIKQLLTVLMRLRSQGNTIVVIEHNLDVIKTADWIIDLGPEGGNKGGKIIATGTPEDVAQCAESYTGQFLKPLL
ncbi:MAG: excinuclease ABC subunit A [Legionellales bacterium RIFCSPHIGHO2_12_FULL_42_9]|nr:MAG: excinuclease ABC subunit A [Legionellales bacterium RIFCSPHIGHO2_12_FULL_42_9]